MKIRRTKIVATLGPATDDRKVFAELIRSGADVVRVNFSHGDAEDKRRRVQMAREIAAETGSPVGVLGDLQGPKIRIDKFVDGFVTLINGARFTLDAELDPDAGDIDGVGIAYKDLPQDVKPGDELSLGDGNIVLDVEEVDGSRVICRVSHGGVLSNNKGINPVGGGLSAGALTDKDREDIKLAAELDVDFLAVSFPRSAEDIHEARRLFKEAGGDGDLVAKIERAEAVENIDSIIEASDVVMVARGDLAVEIGDARLPGVQKKIISRVRELNRVAITATQMMESMIESPVPTRAEVLDVANAVLDGTDAVMLSAETAVGKFPVRTVEAMARVCLGAEAEPEMHRSRHRLDDRFDRADEAIAMATMYAANHFPVRAIVALTESGSTAMWMSRIRSGIPIYALTSHQKTRARVTLYSGVYPVELKLGDRNPVRLSRAALDKLLEHKAIDHGDCVVITLGELSGVSGGTNTMKLVRID